MRYSCREVFVHWMIPMEPGTLGATQVASETVRGVALIETVRAPEGAPFPWLIRELLYEFNSLAYAVNLGMYRPDAPVA